MKKYTNITKYILFAILFIALSGCDNKNMKDVKSSIIDFQNSYNRQEFLNMYLNTSNEFKKAMSEKDFLSLMTDKMRVLGVYKYSKVLFSQEINNTIIRITFISTYENYTLAEEFTYKNEGKYKLVGYLLDNGGKIVPVTKTKDSVRIDIGTN